MQKHKVMIQQPKYLFYATLLDKYEGYINSLRIYQEYWQRSEDPAMTGEEFQEIQRLSLIDSINRVPFESEAADRGTAFNEIIDCLIENRKSKYMVINKVYQEDVIVDDYQYNGDDVICKSKRIHTGNIVGINAIYKERTFYFPIELCREFANYFKGATTQVLTEAILPTQYGNVLLYGYIDELMPVSVHDIKMTSKYSVGKFKHNWQHIVYPYCLNQEGNRITDFEYDIAHINIKKSGFDFTTHIEHYSFVPDRDIPRLIYHVEGLIEFIEEHKELITDKKIFNIN